MHLEEQRRLLEQLARQRDYALQLTRELIRTPSPNPPGDERAVANVIVRELRSHGLEPQIIAKAPERPNVLVELGHKASGPRMVMNGHLDTKPPGPLDRWQTDPYMPVEREDHLFGLGAADNKGQVAAMISAAVALKSCDLPSSGSVLLALSADEEEGSAFGIDFLLEEGLISADGGLVAEASGITTDWERLAVVTNGFSGFTVRVFGTQIHSSLANIVPTVNASTEMAYVMSSMQRDLKLRFPPHHLCPEGPRINVGVAVRGGVGFGIIPGCAEFDAEVRSTPGMTRQSLEEDLNAFFEGLRQKRPALKLEWHFVDGPLGWNEGVNLSPEDPIFAAAQNAALQVLAHTMVPGSLPFGTDGASLARAGITAIPAFGPGLVTMLHSPNENISIEGIRQAAEIYALTALNYTSGQKCKSASR